MAMVKCDNLGDMYANREVCCVILHYKFTNFLGDSCSGRPIMAGSDIDIKSLLAQRDAIIREQQEQIIRLKRELDGVATERDLLLCENSNLRFELEMVELKRLQDESFAPKMERSQLVNMMGSTDHKEQTYIQAPNFTQSQNYANKSSPINYCRTSPSSPNYVSVTQTLHKKSSFRNGEVILKRSRVQTTYELSQDILDKQIEVLERKYGGDRARLAALTIQRAYRR